MPESQAALTFARQLRWALHHLYDPGELQKSPLFEVLGVSPQAGPSALRRVLLEAVEALKPRPDTAPEARGWRIYRALHHRYGEQFTPHEVAKALGLSVRQLRRQESLALRVLADYLWTRYELGARLPPEIARTPAPGGAQACPAEAPSREQELHWLEESLPRELVAVGEAIEGALRVTGSLRATLAVEVECHLPADLPSVLVPGSTLRQGVLDTLTAAIRAVPGGRVAISARASPPMVLVEVAPRGRTGPGLAPPPAAYGESLEMARQLVALCHGTLELVPAAAPDRPFTARLAFPSAQQAAVLVVDDNGDTLQLFQRYLLGTPYSFVGTRDPQQALALARQVRPLAVVLDVMLPGVDGWELLGRLREDPLTRDIPVIVCTILPEEELALSLGAAAYLRKPVSPASLLSSLGAQVRPQAQGSP